jgi:uncharacterized protein (TIGR03435 family)
VRQRNMSLCAASLSILLRIASERPDRLLLATVGPILFGMLNAPEVRAQDSARKIEAASIRPASFPNEDFFRGWTAYTADTCAIGARSPAISGSRLSLPKITLCQLIVMGYGVQSLRIAGAPAWMTKIEQSNYYDVQIKAEGEEGLTEEQARGLLRTVVADRFHVTLHRNNEALPVYELTVGKSGPKFQETPEEGRSQRNGVPIASYIISLSRYVDRPIVDKTGLTGTHYAFVLDQKELAEDLQKDGIKPVPSVFRVVEEQLGLTLKPAKEPMDVLVIDHAESPSDN